MAWQCHTITQLKGGRLYDFYQARYPFGSSKTFEYNQIEKIITTMRPADVTV